MADTVWWSCTACGSYVELPAAESAGFDLACPDCPGELTPEWSWEDREAA